MIWLLLKKEDSEPIKRIVDSLAKNYDAPRFLPHITVYGVINENLEAIRDGVRESIAGINPFIVRTSKFSHSDNIWKTIFVKIQSNSQLQQINHCLAEKMSEHANYIFEPHISFIYKNLDRSVRKKILKKMHVKKELTVDKISIIKYSYNVDEWKIVKSLPLFSK